MIDIMFKLSYLLFFYTGKNFKITKKYKNLNSLFFYLL
jgi:hypothetical protein